MKQFFQSHIHIYRQGTINYKSLQEQCIVATTIEITTTIEIIISIVVENKLNFTSQPLLK